MTTAPPNPDRDAPLDAAWREHSRDEPPAHVDAAILAAAHRAVGSVPHVAQPAAEATSPQRWWMPLAAAATIGAVALGILQLAPQEPVPTATVSDVTSRDHPAMVERNETTSAAAKLDAATPAQAPDAAAAAPPAPNAAPPTGARNEAGIMPKPPARQDTASAPSRAPAAAPAQPSVPSAPASGANVTAFSAAPAGEVAGAARNAPAASDALAPSKRDVASVPQPFPADTERRKVKAPDAGTGARADKTATLSEPMRTPTAPASPPAPIVAPVERADAGTALGKLAPEKDLTPRAAAPAPYAQSVPPPAAAPASAPDGKPDADERDAKTRDEAPVRGQGMVSAAANGSAATAKKAASAESAAGASPDPDAWMTRIRKLYDEGRLPAAAKELNAMRAAYPDADRRLPAAMRAWAATVKP